MSKKRMIATLIQTGTLTPRQQATAVKPMDYGAWPVVAYGRAHKPQIEREQWTAWISAGGQNDAVVCHSTSRENVLALRRHILNTEESKFLWAAIKAIKKENEERGDSDRTSALIGRLLADHKVRFQHTSGR